jgi:hypothetical protein
MCVFCTSVPATLAVGATLKAKEQRERREAEKRGETTHEKKKISVGNITFVVAGMLMVTSALYHSQFHG